MRKLFTILVFCVSCSTNISDLKQLDYSYLQCSEDSENILYMLTSKIQDHNLEEDVIAVISDDMERILGESE